MKPRVLALVRWPVGGIRTWCRYVYRSELFDSMQIDIILPRVTEAETLQQDLAGKNVTFRFVDESAGSKGFVATALKAIGKGRYALVHSHGFTSALAAFTPCLVKRIPHLVTTHDVILDEQYRDLRGRLARRALSLVLRKAEYVQAVSTASAANLRDAFPRAHLSNDRLVTVPNGIETERFLKAKSLSLREELSIPSDALLVGFFGRFMSQKGFRYIVEAVRTNCHESGPADRRIFVLAVGNDGFRREEEIAIEAAGMSERFRFVDFSPNVANLMRSVDVVVMPSLWEACGLLAMEALVAGSPLVVGDCQALTDICRGTPAKVVARRDPGQLLNGILEQATDSAKRAAEEYRNEAAERFDVRRTCAGIHNLYQKLVRASHVAVVD